MTPTVTSENQHWAERIQVFEYPATPDASGKPEWQQWPEESVLSETDNGKERIAEHNEEPAVSDFEHRLAEECQRTFEGGRDRGRQEGRQVEREAHIAELQAIKERRIRESADLLECFSQAREDYLRDVEPEVVKLALAIASRILRREAHMDHLLLTGAVRVALGQLSGSTEVRLYVPAPELDLWTAAVALIPNLALKPSIAVGENMRLGDCRIEAAQGSVDLGIRSQLEEIERGFFDGSPRSRLKAPKVSESASDGVES